MEQLRMLRPAGVPRLDGFPPPEGYSIRAYRDSCDGLAWCRCCIGADLGIESASVSLFEQRMLRDPLIRPEGILFIENPNGEIAGTATALPPERGAPEPGVLHMVAIRGQSRGLGLSAPVCAAAVRLLGDWGLPACQLRTDDFRLNAIRTYLRLGFLPMLYLPDMRMRWEAVLKEIGRTACEALGANGEPAPTITI